MVHSTIGRILVAGAACTAATVITACGSSSDKSGSTSKPAAKQQQAATSEVSWPRIDGPKTTPTIDGDSVSVNVGNGHTITWKKGTPLKIAFFQQGQSNTYLQANTKGVKDAARAAGAHVTVFDAQFKPTTQYAQIQNALSSHRYNAAIVLPVESQGSCQALTKTLPGAQIPVVVIAQQTCGRDEKSGEDLWSPGIVSWVGNDYPALYTAWAESVAKGFMQPSQAILIAGPEGNGPSNTAEAAVKRVSAEHPNLKLVDVARTDYTTAQALTSTQNLLQAHPKVTTVLVQYGGQVPGVVQALKQAGKADTVKVYDAGGSEVEKRSVLDGALESTVPLYPYTQSACAVQMLAALHDGKPVPRVVLNDCHSNGQSPSVQSAIVLTKSNISSFKPEY